MAAFLAAFLLAILISPIRSNNLNAFNLVFILFSKGLAALAARLLGFFGRLFLDSLFGRLLLGCLFLCHRGFLQ